MIPLFFDWFYIEAPKAFLQSVKALSLALFNYFSIPLLVSTLIEPWRKDAVDMTRVPMHLWYQVILNNVISRIIGFMVRSAVIVAGVFVLFVLTVLEVIFFVAWYLLPILLGYSMVYGFYLIAKGGT